MTGVILFAFVVYFYLPHVIFKSAAERFIDLGRKPDASQLEEIATAVLPSAILHGLSFLTIRTITLLPGVHFPGPDWRTLWKVITGANVESLVFSDAQAWWTISYAVVLACVSFVNGLLYGKAAFARILYEADPDLAPEAEATLATWPDWKLNTALIFGIVWDFVYADYQVPHFRWATIRPFMFVKLHGELLHGRFVRYERSREGIVEAITLENVTRYSRVPTRELLARGENPLRPLDGQIYLKWSEIVNLNLVPESTLQQLNERYEAEAAAAREPKRG